MNSTTLNTRNFRTYADVVNDALRRSFAGPNMVKRIARVCQGSPRTVENWIAGHNAPSGENLILLMAECDDLARAVLALVEERKKDRACESSLQSSDAAVGVADAGGCA